MTGFATLSNFLAFNAQVIAIVIAAALLLRVLALPTAGGRYASWRLALALSLLTPWLLRSAPAPAVAAAPPAVVTDAAPAAVTTIDLPADVPAPAVPAWPSLPWTTIATVVLFAGAALRALWLAGGLWRLRLLRRQALRADDELSNEVQAVLGTRAQIASVPELTQPVTFGVWRPVVLLPEGIVGAPVELRRAVLTHELLHVQRRDWCWIVVEELLRTALWFQPAIWWATSRIQLAREQVVDELTVLATGNRRTYIEALLAFADGAQMRPAPAFSRRAHLFARIVGLSKASVMSSSRVVASGAAVVVALACAAVSASAAFPIFLVAAPLAAASAPPSFAPATDSSTAVAAVAVADRGQPRAQASPSRPRERAALDQQLQAANDRYTRARTALIVAETAYRAVQQNPDHAAVDRVPSVVSLRARVAELQVQRERLLARYGSRHSLVIGNETELTAASRQLELERRRVIESMQLELTQARALEQAAKGDLQRAAAAARAAGDSRAAAPAPSRQAPLDLSATVPRDGTTKMSVAFPQAGAADIPVKPITPENPIPRRLSAPAIPYPAENRGSGVRATIVFRIVLDASGSVTTVSRVVSGITGQGSRVVGMSGFETAAEQMLRLWRYQPPADAPIAFYVTVAFDGEGDATTTQSETARTQVVGAVRPPASLPVLEARLASLESLDADLTARLGERHPDRLRNRLEIEAVRAQIAVLRGGADAAPPLRVLGPGSVTSAAGPFRVGGNIRPPQKTKHVAPEYPAIAQTSRVQGVVIVEAIIDEQGRVAEARILRSIPLLDRAALDAATQWEFSPTVVDGRAVPVVMTVTIQFTLAEQPTF